MSTSHKLHYNHVPKIDLSHLVSKEQIEIVKDSVQPGDHITFQYDEEEISGEVSQKYPYVFKLKDGRTFTWVNYVTGSSRVLRYLREFYPIEIYACDNTFNPFKHGCY